jgi:rhomboid protease GluP
MTDEFVYRLAQATPRMWVTKLLIGINVGVWLLNVVTGVDPMAPRSADLLAWGGNMWPYTMNQPWRLLTATVLHGGLLHLGFNMWALWDTGRIVERFYGNIQFALIYLVAGTFGSLASLFFAARTGVSIGASGAIFGVVGALLAALFTKHDKLPSELVASLRTSTVVFVGFSLFMGFTSSHIDNSAHIGGLVSGFAMAVIMAGKFDWEAFRRGAAPRALAALALALVAGFGLWRLLPVPVN